MRDRYVARSPLPSGTQRARVRRSRIDRYERLVSFGVSCKHIEVPTYEYLILAHTHETNWAEIRNKTPRLTQTFTQTYYIRRPNATEPEKLPGDTPIGVIFNDLGREGWRLVTSEILDSTVITGGNYYGWDEVGFPVRQRWTFIREAGS
jgi:hypothetical protein